MTTTVRPRNAGIPALTRISAESLSVTDRFTPPIGEYVALDGIQVFACPAADMPQRAHAFLWDEADTETAIVVADNLDPKDVEDVVYALVTRWHRAEPGQYRSAQYDGVSALAVRKTEAGAR
ncbi:hypothetical protein [Yinghuangia sp. YIM S10712]|uniref:hypothetical protein n=1 Tax=Yinghuangia sp. YIM S10712 TaxID=3436930 RepID=UPI003F52B1D7